MRSRSTIVAGKIHEEKPNGNEAKRSKIQGRAYPAMRRTLGNFAPQATG